MSDEQTSATETNLRILIIRQGESADRFRTLLEKDFGRNCCTICDTGADARRLIDGGETFDVVVMGMVLPPEEETLLDQCGETGLRLIQMMIDQGTCMRFYVVTIRGDMEAKAGEACKDRALLRFFHHLDFDEAAFKDDLIAFLEEPLPVSQG